MLSLADVLHLHRLSYLGRCRVKAPDDLPSFWHACLLTFLPLAAGTEFCQNLGLMTADPFFKVEVQEFVPQPGETLAGFDILPDSFFADRLSQINIRTSSGRVVKLGFAENNNQGFAPISFGISKLGMGSGVLDGLVFTMGHMTYLGMPVATVLKGLGPITLQRYTSMLLKVDKFDPDVPVDLPTRASTYNLNVSAGHFFESLRQYTPLPGHTL